MKTLLPKPTTPTVLANKIARKLTGTLPGIIKRLPEPPFILQKKIGEKILQQLMSEPIEMGDFDFLQNKWLQISVNDMGLVFFLSFADDKLILSNQISQADVSFTGDSKEFILLASRSEDPDTLFFQRRLVIEGDTELGLYIKNSIDGIDFDSWPKWLNQIIQKVASLVSDNHVLNTEINSHSPQENNFH
ncbi:MAG: SCP2 sterol-binding domain-containing protein [gamma proteobacterium symbiont of Bathyaustriella thionipta]|nr:SCP2 sterol-binding domain-containing protein [gamma proteobacterium symbiont of Bathyaustriella thionipta]MCU7951522.1 SCP2 sterol-binding domain-containing protein [gamma proteobacterium symbiont of Bathyaustriella thionipta]MCU7951896.1 SCP2 sterol-binding domain-containing protein [gamma proteobacterium symbiont of Bathyaustriella thionipta]MCU7958095.1 SCP2 sterol-binding domain-containing protein [gamma proteobacterium symbiont of Bathyaustriella thionipta]MCU7966334.1 SCP2 sterol-bind